MTQVQPFGTFGRFGVSIPIPPDGAVTISGGVTGVVLLGADDGEISEHASRILDNEFYKAVVEPKLKTFLDTKKSKKD